MNEGERLRFVTGLSVVVLPVTRTRVLSKATKIRPRLPTPTTL